MKEGNMNWWEDVKILNKNKLDYRAILSDSKKSILSLNGVWKFKYFDDISPTNTKNEVDIFKQNNWDKIDVPGCWEMNGFGEPNYANVNHVIPYDPPRIISKNPTGIYQREIEIKNRDILQNRVILRLNGLDSIAKIFINNKFVGIDKNARVTSEFDISKFIKEGKNKIQLIVAKFSDISYMEDQDMWRFGGIFRDVELVFESKKSIRDVYIQTDADLKNSKGLVTVNLDCPSSKGTISISKDKKIIKEINFDTKVSKSPTISVDDVKLWSSENPELYDLRIKTEDSNISMRVGFKYLEIRDRKLLVNGIPIKVRGVNMHDFSSTKGRVMSKADTLKNLKMMKDFNVNAIRTSHYPKAHWFYELCNEMGFWVMDEADLESHGLFNAGNWCALAEDNRYLKHHLEKAKQMILRDRNNVSVFSFSLGNEAGTGNAFKEMAKYIRKNTSSNNIFIHYEGDYSCEIADVNSNMYTWVEDTPYLVEIEKGNKKEPFTARTLDLIKAGKLGGKKSTKLLSMPHIECEYAHAMGNGAGSLKDYWDYFYRNDSFMGGFIWEWFDHGLKIKGRKDYQYGGDFIHEKNDSNFCIDGLLLPNGKPSPALVEMKEVYSPVGIEINKTNNDIIITNKYNFSEVSDKVDLFVNEIDIKGKVVSTTELSVPSMKRLTSRTHKFISKSKDCFILEVEAKDKKGNSISKVSSRIKGYIVVKNNVIKNKVTESNESIKVSNGNKFFAINKMDGSIKYINNKKEVFKGNLLNYWRPMIDNERLFKQDKWKNKFFMHLSNNRLISFKNKSNENQSLIETTVRTSSPNQPWGFETKYTYEFNKSGFNVKIKSKDRFNMVMVPNSYPNVVWNKAIPNENNFKPFYLPRIGFDFKIDKSFTEVNYLGLGPIENYSDSMEAAKYNLYKTTIKGLWTDYVYPQENGNRQSVNRIELSNNKNKIVIQSRKGLDFNYSIYSQKNIEDAKHPSDLKRGKENYLSLNYKNGPLGSGACGPIPMRKYLLKNEGFTMEYSIEFE